MCGEPPEVNNSTLETQGYNVGHYTEYECIINYKVAGASVWNMTSTCELNPDNGTAGWTTPSHCEGNNI